MNKSEIVDDKKLTEGVNYREKSKNFPSKSLSKPINTRKRLLIFIAVTIGILAIATLLLWNGTPYSSKHLIPKALNISISNQANQNVFVSGYPNFDNLTLANFPIQLSLRNIFSYKNHLIAVGYNMIYEIDDASKHIVRHLVPEKLPCTNWSTKINNYLYIICHNGVYNLDLDSGNIIKSYIDVNDSYKHREESDSFSFTNSTITHFRDTLWIGGYNGVLAINTRTDKTSLYTRTSFGDPEGSEYFIKSNNAFVWVVAYKKGGSETTLRIYNPKTDRWHELSKKEMENIFGQENKEIRTFGYNDNEAYFYTGTQPTIIAKYTLQKGLEKNITLNSNEIDQLSRQFGLMPKVYETIRAKYFPNLALTDGAYYFDDRVGKISAFHWPDDLLPGFYALSNKFNDTYYLSSFNGIWQLNRGDNYPSIFTPYDINNYNAHSLFITDDGKYLVMPGTDESNLPQEVYPKILLLEIATKKLTNLSPTISQFKLASEEDRKKYIDIASGNFTSLSQSGNIISISRNDPFPEHKVENSVIGEINLITKRFSLK